MTVADAAGDVSNTDMEPIADAHPFVDIVQVDLTVDEHMLTLAIETGGPIPQSLANDEEMWWAIELSDSSSSLHRITIILSGSEWVVSHYDFSGPHEEIPAELAVSGSRLEVAIPLAELPRLHNEFYWWTAAIWNGHAIFGGESYGDSAPDGDPVSYPNGSEDVGPNYDMLPAAVAPLGLGSIEMPSDSSGVADLFEALPDTVAGFERYYPFGDRPTPGEHHASYGVAEDAAGRPTVAIHLVAIDLQGPTSDFSIGATGRDVIEYFAGGYDHDVDAAGRDGNLGWVRWHRIGGPSEQDYGLAWAEEDSGWYFSAVAESPEYLDALVEALVEAAGTSAMTPGATSTAANGHLEPVVDESISLSGRPYAIAADAESVWVSYSGDLVTRVHPETGEEFPATEQFIARIDLVTGSIIATIELEFAATDLAVGHDSLWATQVGGGGVETIGRGARALDAVVRIDPETNAVFASVPIGGGMSSIAVGDDAIWAVSGTNEDGVYRIDPASNQIVENIRLDNPHPLGTLYLIDVMVSEDAVWIAAGVDHAPRPLMSYVFLIDANDNSVSATVAVDIDRITALAVDARGDLWAGGMDFPDADVFPFDGALWRIGRDAGNVMEVMPILVSGLALDEGTLWISNCPDGTLTALDVRTHPSIIASIAIGTPLPRESPPRASATFSCPTDLVIADGHVWVVLAGDGAVVPARYIHE